MGSNGLAKAKRVSTAHARHDLVPVRGVRSGNHLEASQKLPQPNAYNNVGQKSEKWREMVEDALRDCPCKADLAYVESLLARLKVERFRTEEDTLVKMRAAKAERRSAMNKRLLRGT